MPKPVNLNFGDARLKYVESDLYGIAERIKELDPSLSVVLHEGHSKPWVVVERGSDGDERFVARYEELDSRVLDHLRYIAAVPFEKRIEKLQREANAENKNHGRMTEEQFDRFARDFYDAGKKSGIIDPVWSKNMPLSARQMKKKPKKESGA